MVFCLLYLRAFFRKKLYAAFGDEKDEATVDWSSSNM
jgi:hypothetical protein